MVLESNSKLFYRLIKNMSKQKLPKWFEGTLYDKGDKVVNSFSGESYELNAMELSMYDFIMGSQMLIEMQGAFNPATRDIQDQMRKGLDWFKETNSKAYKILLD
tara:strand:+ start:113 stop:424 length:312 start_codon:yes stop_codon:yes gene_type:complete